MRSLLNVQNKERTNHICFDGGITLLSGFGCQEGPYLHLNLPEIVWGLGPRSRIVIPPQKGRKAIVSLHVQNYLSSQRIKISNNGKCLAETNLDLNFSNAHQKFQKIDLLLNDAGQENELLVEYANWEKDKERPIAVLFSKMKIELMG